MTYTIETTAEFNEWFKDQDDKIKGFVRARLSRIQDAGHFGIVKAVGDGVLELKWKKRSQCLFRILGAN